MMDLPHNEPRSLVPSFTLPQKTIDGIIDALEGDKTALSTTSLLCRAWSTRSRVHLFRTLHVHEGRDTAPRFREFLLFLCSASGQLKPFVKVLHLRGDYPHTRPEAASDKCVISPDYLRRLKEELPYLRELHLEQIRLERSAYRSGFQEQGLSLPQNHDQRPPLADAVDLEKLILDLPHSLEIFVETLNVFPNLASLELESYRFLEIPEYTPSTVELVHRRLGSLNVVRDPFNLGYEDIGILSLIQALPPPNALRRLEFSGNYTLSLRTISDFISGNIGTQLTHIKITLFESCYVPDCEQFPLRFSTCSQLESLSLVIYLHRTPAHTEPIDINYGLSAFETLSPSSNPFLRCLSLRFNKQRDFDVDTQRVGNEHNFDWERLDKAVGRNVWLTRFEFGYTYNGEELREPERFLVMESLPKVKEMGVLVML